jgi:hypothetical protein
LLLELPPANAIVYRCPSQLDFGTYHQVSSFAEVQLDSFFGPELYAAPNIAVPNAAISQTIDPIDQASEYFQSLPVDELERVLYYLSEFSLQPASFTADASAASNPQSSSPISAVASPIAPLFAFTPPVTPSYAEAPLSSPSPLDAHPRHDVVVCEWDSCGALLPPQKDGKAEKVITAHFREAHGFLSTTPGKHVCRWADCNTAACGRSLRKHIAAHCRASAACPDCGDVFARTDSVIRHRAANVCSKCTMCNTRFDSVAERRAHVVMGMCEGKRPGRPQTVLRGQRRPSPY